jgi:hypothetical protein
VASTPSARPAASASCANARRSRADTGAPGSSLPHPVPGNDQLRLDDGGKGRKQRRSPGSIADVQIVLRNLPDPLPISARELDSLERHLAPLLNKILEQADG